MSKQPSNQVTKKDMIRALNFCINHSEEQDARILMLSSLLHSYIEFNGNVDAFKKYLEDEKQKQEKQNKKENKDAS